MTHHRRRQGFGLELQVLDRFASRNRQLLSLEDRPGIDARIDGVDRHADRIAIVERPRDHVVAAV